MRVFVSDLCLLLPVQLQLDGSMRTARLQSECKPVVVTTWCSQLANSLHFPAAGVGVIVACVGTVGSYVYFSPWELCHSSSYVSLVQSGPRLRPRHARLDPLDCDDLVLASAFDDDQRALTLKSLVGGWGGGELRLVPSIWSSAQTIGRCTCASALLRLGARILAHGYRRFFPRDFAMWPQTQDIRASCAAAGHSFQYASDPRFTGTSISPTLVVSLFAHWNALIFPMFASGLAQRVGHVEAFV